MQGFLNLMRNCRCEKCVVLIRVMDNLASWITIRRGENGSQSALLSVVLLTETDSRLQVLQYA